MKLSADDDRHDVARVLAGDHEAFAALVVRHQGRLVSYLRRCVGPGDAEDLAQETLVRAYQALARYDPLYPFRGWLLVIASRLAANHRAKRRPERLTAEGGSMLTSDPSLPMTDADELSHLLKRLDAALLELPGDSRALYELRFRQQLSLEELAHHFELSHGAIKVRIHRLRRALALRLGVSLEVED